VLLWPRITLRLLVWLYGFYAVVDGLLALAALIVGGRLVIGGRGWLILEGVVGIAAGLFAFLWPDIAQYLPAAGVPVSHDAMFFAGIAWLTVLLGVAVVSVGRARTTAECLVALDTAVLMLLGLLGLVAAQSRRTYALDAALILALLSFVSTVAASRYLGDRRPFTEPEEGDP
jgi:multisubunit Na+/H+ antiporter MnhF subunit